MQQGKISFSENPLENSKDRQLALAWCRLRVHFLSMTCLSKMLFVFMCISEEEHKDKSKLLRQTRARYYPWAVPVLRAPQSCTICYDLALHRKILTSCVFWNFLLHFIHPPCHVFDSLCHSECSAFISCKVPASKHQIYLAHGMLQCSRAAL